MTETTRLVPGSKAYEAQSKTVGDTFTVRVYLPYSYEQTQNNYPVLYLLDGDYSFGLAVATLAYLNLGANFGMGKNVPEMIVVSVGYERGVIPWLLTRVRDFTPTADPSFNYNNPNFHVPESGKADAFLSFLRDDLIPHMESTYRVDSSDRVIATHSMAGVFALHAALSQPGVFGRAILASPFVGWDNKAIFDTEQRLAAATKELPLTAFFTTAAAEPTPDYIAEVRELFEQMNSRGYAGFRAHLEHYDTENHFSEWPRAFAEGLAYVYS
jgi:predicted alpha/beta superfamily hydrolase